MNKNVLVSVIIPVYNSAEYLDECVESILSQDYQNIEIIFVNDGSTDSSVQIIQKYMISDKRIKLISKINGGVSSARNVGIDSARGDYICFCDADDVLAKDYVSHLLYLIIKYDADISLVYSWATTFRKTNKHSLKECTIDNLGALYKLLTYRLTIGVYCKMFSRKLLFSNNIRFVEDIFIGEGFNFNVDCFLVSTKVAMSNKTIYFYRRNNENSATTKFALKKWKNAIFAINRIGNRLPSTNKKIMRAFQYAKWHTYNDAFNSTALSGVNEDNKDFYYETKKYSTHFAYTSFFVKISFRERIKGIIVIFFPTLIVKLLKNRYKKHSSKE